MQQLTAAIGYSELSWYALKLGCLMARADANSLSLLRAGGVGATLETLRADWPDESASRVEVALALMQNVAYSNEGVTTILHAGGVGVVLGVMKEHAHAVAVQKNGLGVLWNLCDSDEHWAAFLSEGPSMAAVLLATMRETRPRRPEHRVTSMTSRRAARPAIALRRTNRDQSHADAYARVQAAVAHARPYAPHIPSHRFRGR
mmetsp:Transcript_50693/g.134028  ORF Transcript_50693/g.134028 Transcript_50693/m.134028 type:complete len:203 (-) Transcript_50693:44-652(-)